jgi:dephospho-CoA kinase
MMPLFAVTGFSGAGKTTAIDFISKNSKASRVYVGQLIYDEVLRRGLSPGADSERIVRLDFRQRHGMAGLAALVAPVIRDDLERGGTVLVDAVYSIEEFDYYREHCNAGAQLISVEASFDIRADRVAVRQDKTLTRAELLKRDELERVSLRTDLAIASATISMRNEGSLGLFQDNLRIQICALISSYLR